jgi:hypothetical protein
VPEELGGSPFEIVRIVRRKRWRESTLWWPATRTLVVADALGTNRFYTGGKATLGVHVLLRLTPPRMLARYEPDRLLVGHGEGISGPEASPLLRAALDESRRRLPGVLLRLPLAARRE